MTIRFTPHILPLLVTTILALGFIYPVWRYRRHPEAPWFAATLAALVVWSLGYAFEIMAIDLHDKILLANLQYLGVPAIVVCWWEITRRYVGIRHMPKIVTTIIWAIPVLTVVMAFANPWNLFRVNPSIVNDTAPFPVLHPDYGPWYWWVLIPSIILIMLATIAVLVRALVHAERPYRHQYLLLLVALTLPMVGNLLYIFDFFPWRNYNPAPSLLGVSCVLVVIGLFRYQLFAMVPVARDTIIDNLADGVLVVDRLGHLVDLNRAAETMTGLKRQECIGCPVTRVLAKYPALIEILTSQAGPRMQETIHVDMVMRTGNTRSHISVTCSSVATKRGYFMGRAAVLHDITERVRLLEQTRELANRDDLTGIPNRRHFLDLTVAEMERAHRHNIPLSFLLMDIDHFKNVNDTFGHLMGNELLRELAKVCRSALRANDIVGRLGGEEFGVLLPETRLEEAIDVAGRLRKTIEALRVSSPGADKMIAMTVSMGISELRRLHNGEIETLEAFCGRADAALYTAKRSGRNMVVASRETSILHAVV